MKVSVIVPIYNVENYIYECIASIIKQTLQDIEIILVNDGSTDDSIIKIQKLIDNNKNIRLINKENGGLSSARNTGLQFATGDYVAFIDSDDYIEPSFLQQLYEEAIKYNLDIAIGGYKKLYSNIYESIKRNNNLVDIGVTTGVNFLKNEMKCKDYRMEVWDVLYRREFLEKNNLTFEEGLVYEDELFTPLALFKATRVKLIETNGYIYRQRQNSIMSNKPNINHINSTKYLIDKFIEYFYATSSEDIKYIVSRNLISLTSGYEKKIILSDLKNKKQLLKKIKDIKLINAMKYTKELTFKQKFRYFLLRYSSTLFYYYINLKNHI